MSMNEFTKNLSLKRGVPKHLIEEIESKLQIKLPKDYEEFLLVSNGVSGFVCKSYLIIWPVEDIQEINLLASINEFAPGLIMFGSNGGGESYAFDARQSILSFVEFYDMEMSPDKIRFCGYTFHEFLEHLYNKVF
jgi:SMI1 / KNR4 family (SUKH-1)